MRTPRPGTPSPVPVPGDRVLGPFISKLAVAGLIWLTLAAQPAPTSAQCLLGEWNLTGSVTDSLGVGIAGCDIDLLNSNGVEVFISQDFTNALGAFSLCVPGQGAGTFTIVINPPVGSSYLGTQRDQFLTSSTSILPFSLEDGFFVFGTVVNESGAPLVDADLRFADSVTGTTLNFSGEATDLNGAFSVLVPPGTYDIDVRDTIATTPTGPYVRVEFNNRLVDADQNLGLVTLRNGYQLTGTVLNESASPVNMANIDVIDPATGIEVPLSGDETGLVTNPGQFSVLVPEGTWDVEIEPPPGSGLAGLVVPITVNAPGPASIGTQTLLNGVPVTGTTETSNGSPVAAVDLDFVIASTGVEIPTIDDNANAQGQFSVVVAPEVYDIQFKPPFATGLAPRELTGVSVAGTTSLGPITLSPGPALSGTITLGGTPFEGARMTLSDGGADVFVFGDRSNSAGFYQLRALAGTYDVTANPPPGSGASPLTMTNVTLTTDTTLDFELNAVPPPPVQSLSCSTVGASTTVSWVLGATDYDSIEVFRDGVLVVAFGGTEMTIGEPGLAVGAYQYRVVAIRAGMESDPRFCTAVIGMPPEVSFVRGDTNGNGGLSIADPITALNGLFAGNVPLGFCLDAYDFDDDGVLNIADPIGLLQYLFAGGPPPMPPFPAAGTDPTPDALNCFD